MMRPELHITETAGWRALLTHAQLESGVHLSPCVEEHVVSLLFHFVGADVSGDALEHGFLERIECTLSLQTDDPGAVGDQCLLFAGLFPEHAIRKSVPITYFVHVGRDAYRECADRDNSPFHALLSEEFVRCMDVLQTLRALQNDEPCIDGLNAYNLWHDLGSAHAWRVLRAMTAALPASGDPSTSMH